MKQKNVAESRTTMYGPDDIVRVRNGINAGMIAARIAPAQDNTENEPIEITVPGFSGGENGGEND
jgi:hypothetical protein